MAGHFTYLSEDLQKDLKATAEAIVAPGKGIFAIDETAESLGNRLQSVGCKNTDDNHRLYRQMLFTTDPKIGNYVSAVILFPYMLTEKTDSGVPFQKLLKDREIIPGVNVDKGLVPLLGTDGETTTQGLDDLGKRCQEYKMAGFKFAKWRSAYTISEHTPSHLSLLENANVLARYASTCQQNGLVPIVEPDVSFAGDHDLDRCQKVTEELMSYVFKALNDHHVYLEGILLKTYMVTPGSTCAKKFTPEEVGRATVVALMRTVPAAVPGVTFLSGGQPSKDSVDNLKAICKYKGKKPWVMTFCFGRALQVDAFQIWKGKPENVKAAQEQFLSQARACSEAVRSG